MGQQVDPHPEFSRLDHRLEDERLVTNSVEAQSSHQTTDAATN